MRQFKRMGILDNNNLRPRITLKELKEVAK